MAEDRKPKIDLKSRLQKMGGPAAATPPPPMAGSLPVPSMAPPATRSGPPMAGPASVPPPSGMNRPMPSGSVSARPAIDPGHPLAAAVAQQFNASAVPAMVQPQRIEMDEGVVHQARSGAFKRGLMAGTVFGFVLLVLGYVGGTAMSEGNARAKSTRDAHDLGTDVGKAKDSLDELKTKLQAGAKTLMEDRKFPADLAQTLAGLNIDFAGDKLTGRRFSGVPADVTHDLFDFITRVQTLNDKKDLVVGLLNKLQKPLTEELAKGGQLSIQYVVVVDKDTSSLGAFLAPLATPIAPDDKNGVPNDLTFANPRGSGNVKLPRLTSDKIPKDGAAITVVPSSVEKLFPSKQRGQFAQLGSTIMSLVGDIEGQKPLEGEAVSEPKPGLEEVASKLAERLNKI